VVEAAVSRKLVAVWGLLLALVIVIVALNWTQPGDEDVAALPSRMLLPVAISQVQAIEIGHAATMHRFERDASGAWFYHGVHTGTEQDHSHQTDPQAAARIEQALDGFGRTQREREVPAGAQGNPYGVVTPQTIVLVYRAANAPPIAQYAVGDLAPDGVSRYVLPLGSPSVLTIPDYQIQNLLNLIQTFAAAAPVR
jgi:hypothetical protein